MASLTKWVGGRQGGGYTACWRHWLGRRVFIVERRRRSVVGGGVG